MTKNHGNNRDQNRGIWQLVIKMTLFKIRILIRLTALANVHPGKEFIPPVDEVCRILARVLARVQSGGPSDTPVVPEVS